MEAYLDNSATTKPYPEVVEEMVSAMTKDYYNPSAAYRNGFEIEKKIKNIRTNIARTLGVKDKNIVFTSGGTEGNNSALRSIVKSRRKHIIVSEIEHPAVLNSARDLEAQGYELSILKVDKKGYISLEELKNTIKKDTALVSIMYVNNEIGTVQPIEEIGKLIKSIDEDILFHVDAVQAYGKINFSLKNSTIDFLTVSAHKLHGPKGTGFIYIKDTNKFKPFITGAGHEFGLRAGTENVPGIYGMGKAIEIVFKDIDNTIEGIREKRNYLLNALQENIEDIHVNSDIENGVCHVLNVSFIGVRGEVLLHYLEGDGICVSTGSACSSKKKGSHVLNAISLSPEEIDSAVRLSLCETTTEEEIDYVVEKLKTYVGTIRLLGKRKR